MLEWHPEQRALLAETLRDIANIATMTGLVVLLGTILLFAAILTLWDGIAYRRQRKNGKN